MPAEQSNERVKGWKVYEQESRTRGGHLTTRLHDASGLEGSAWAKANPGRIFEVIPADSPQVLSGADAAAVIALAGGAAFADDPIWSLVRRLVDAGFGSDFAEEADRG